MPAHIPPGADCTAAGLRRLAARSSDANQGRRPLSLAAIRDGMRRGETTRIGGMDRQTLRDHCPAGYAEHAREEGSTGSMRKAPKGLIDRKAPGPRAVPMRRN